MAKTKQQKDKIVQELAEKLGKTKAVVFTNFDGLGVSEAGQLRDQLREQDVDYYVSKRTLLKLALSKSDMKSVDISQMSGGLGVAFGYKDEIAPAKILHAFAKKNKALKLIGGIFEGEFIDAAQVAALALLPGKEELQGKLVWLLNYPISALVNVMAGNARSLVYVIQAIKETKA